MTKKPIVEVVVKSVKDIETADGIRSVVLLKGSDETKDYTFEIRGTKDEIKKFRDDLNLVKVGIAGLAMKLDQYQKTLEDYDDNEDSEGSSESVEDSEGK